MCLSSVCPQRTLSPDFPSVLEMECTAFLSFLLHTLFVYILYVTFIDNDFDVHCFQESMLGKITCLLVCLYVASDANSQ